MLNNKKITIISIILTISLLSFSVNLNSYFNKKDKSMSKYLIGVMYSSAGDCSEAIPYFEEALELNKDPEIYLELAKCYFYSNGLEKSIELLEESIKLFPDFVKTYQMLGDIYYQNYISGIATEDVLKKAVLYLEKGCEFGKNQEYCIKAIDIAARINNIGTATRIFEMMDLNEIKDPRFLAFVASIYQNTDNVNQIKRIIKVISRLEIKDVKLLDLMTNLSINTSMYSEAKIFMDKIIQLQGENFKVWDKYMFVLLETTDFHKVKDIFNKLYKNNPTVLSLYTLANCYSKEHKYNESIKYYKKIFKINDGKWDKNIIRDIYSDYFKILILTSNKKEALTEVEHFKKQFPNDKVLLLDFFNVYAFNKNKKKALSTLKELETVLKDKKVAENLKEMYLKRPKFLKYRYLGNVYFSLKDYVPSRFFLEKAFKMDDSAKEIGIPLASIYEKQGLIDKVFNVYEKLLKKNLNSPDVLNNYSYSLLIYNRKIDYALELALKAVELSPENPVYRDTLGYAYLLKNDLKNGELHLKFAYSKIAENSEICEHLGDLYFKKSDYKTAIKFWKEAVLNGVENREKVLKKIEEAEMLK